LSGKVVEWEENDMYIVQSIESGDKYAVKKEEAI
jgi:hypothetical protein